MKHLGTKTIETKRLILRKFTIDDAENMYKNWASDDEVTKFLTWPTHKSVEVSKSIIKLWIKEAESEKSYQWCIELKDTKEAIGSIGVVNIFEDVEVVEIGYCIGKSYWKQGIVCEAFKALIDFFFQEVQVNRIEAKHDTNNPGSGKVMSKCGLKFEGIKRSGGINNTGICDIAFYGALKGDWNLLEH